MTNMPTAFITFWNKNKKLNFGQAVALWNATGMRPAIRIVKK